MMMMMIIIIFSDCICVVDLGWINQSSCCP